VAGQGRWPRKGRLVSADSPEQQAGIEQAPARPKPGMVCNRDYAARKARDRQGREMAAVADDRKRGQSRSGDGEPSATKREGGHVAGRDTRAGGLSALAVPSSMRILLRITFWKGAECAGLAFRHSHEGWATFGGGRYVSIKRQATGATAYHRPRMWPALMTANSVWRSSVMGLLTSGVTMMRGQA